jgi:hypothetical protein
MRMQDVYDFFFDVNTLFKKKGLPRLDDEVRPAIMSGLLSDMLTASLARHSRSLTFRQNERGDLGVRTATPGAEGVKKLRSNRIYILKRSKFCDGLRRQIHILDVVFDPHR